MKNFKNEFTKKINNEEIILPESLSAENIEKLINEKGGIESPARIRKIDKKAVLRWCYAAAAVIVLAIGVTAVLGNQNFGTGPAEQQINDSAQLSDEEKQEIIDSNISTSGDYSAIENSVLSHFKSVFDIYVQYTTDDEDGFNFGMLFDGSKDTAAAPESTMNGSVSADNSSTAGNAGIGTHSTTNTQVNGVDEADIVKNDGEYIYCLKSGERSGGIIITRCSDPENMVIKSRIKLPEVNDRYVTPIEMFLDGNKLIIISRQYREYDTSQSLNNFATGDCCCIALFSDTIVNMYDIADKENPREIFSQKISGEYISSRIANSRLIVVTSFSIPYNEVQSTSFDDACKLVKEICIPEYTVNGGEAQRIPADRIRMTEDEEPETYVITSVVDLKKDNFEPQMNAYLGSASEIYCTRDEIFVSQTKHSYWTQNEQVYVKDSDGVAFASVTKIHRMSITSDGTVYNGNVTVGGMCINQFSMDKSGDYFRIATNGIRQGGQRYETMVYVIDKDMNIVGRLKGIAPGEDMKSARFLGNALYFVTFMQTDPLFVIDLSDPANPAVKGELEIPGFSEYLHPVGESLVIGLGKGGTSSGTDGTAKISLFDVSDPCNPRELDNFTTNDHASFVGGHKGFTVIDENTFAAAMHYGFSTSAVIVFDIQDNGIIIRNTYLGKTGSSYDATRGTMINNILYVVNNIGIVSYDINEKWNDHISYIVF